ncbi:MAG: 50S ribosomal protein L25 [Phycisphaerales bacterium]
MHEKSPILTATIRPKIGSRYAQRARKQGGLPAVMYGHGEDPVALTLDAREALRYIHKGEKVFQVEIEGKAEKQLVLLKAVQFDYLGTNIVHADLARASLKDRVHSRVPIHLVGEAIGLKVAGAVLIHPVNEVEIECPLESLPDYVEVDVTALDEEHPITAAKVPLPEGAKLLSDKHGIVAQIVVQKEVEEPTAEAGAVATQAAPEVITAKKEEEAPKADAKKK